MAEGLRALRPDIVLAQECFVCEDTDHDTVSYLAKQLSMRSVVANSRRKKRMHAGAMRDTASGLAILSKGKLEDEGIVELPSSDTGGERLALSVRVVLGDARIRVVCAHFSHVRDERGIRTDQIVETMRSIQGDELSELAVLGGDFNCEPGDVEVTAALGKTKFRFVNALLSVGCADPTCPLPPSSRRPGRQIDQIWFESRSLSGPRCVDAGVAMNQPVAIDGMYPSDHAAVWVELDLG